MTSSRIADINTAFAQAAMQMLGLDRQPTTMEVVEGFKNLLNTIAAEIPNSNLSQYADINHAAGDEIGDPCISNYSLGLELGGLTALTISTDFTAIDGFYGFGITVYQESPLFDMMNEKHQYLRQSPDQNGITENLSDTPDKTLSFDINTNRQVSGINKQGTQVSPDTAVAVVFDILKSIAIHLVKGHQPKPE